MTKLGIAVALVTVLMLWKRRQNRKEEFWRLTPYIQQGSLTPIKETENTP